MAESEEKLKNLLIKMKEESEKAGLNKLSIQNHDHGFQSHHFMVDRKGKSVESKKSGLKLRNLRSWHLVPSLHGKIDGEKLETMTDYFLGLQNHCRW